MKFTTSLNTRYSNGKDAPLPWLESNAETEKKAILEYFHKEIEIYDADTCGNEKVEFVFESGNAYLLDYTWWIEYNPDWRLCDELDIKQIPLEEVENCPIRYRDWIEWTHPAKKIHEGLW